MNLHISEKKYEKTQYYGLDLLKFFMALLVAARHVIQIYYPAESRWRLVIGNWLSNLAVPIFFVIAGFLLFKKLLDTNPIPAKNLTNIDSPSVKKFADTDWTIIRRYVCRILRLYILWCVIYWPIDIYNWCQSGYPLGESILYYFQSFLFSSTITQLWYLPALATACLIVWAGYKADLKIWMLLLLTSLLFIFGCSCNNQYFLEHSPRKIQEFIHWYAPIFLTTRNGLFYGSLYVALGLWFSKKQWHMPPILAAAGSLIFLGVMYKEVSTFSNANMVFSAVPAVVCLVELAMGLKGTSSRFFLFLREQSEWVYFSHYYFIHLFTWTIHYNPLPMTKANIMLSVLVPMFLFTLLIAFLSHRKHGKWLRALI